MATESEGPIADVEDEDLKQVTRTLVTQPEVDASDTDRFFGQVQALVEDRARRAWPSEGSDTIAVFIRAQYPREAAAGLAGTKPSADMIGTDEPLLGRIFILDRNASQGWSAPLPHTDPGEIVQWLADSFGNCQAIILYRQTLLLVDRAKGAAKGATRQEAIRAVLPAASKPSLFDALDLFQREVLTPKVCPEGVWKPRHANRYYAGATPETSIQGRLKTFLNGWFRGLLRAEVEDSTEIGRIDIRLLAPGGPTVGLTYWGVVELKVVKSFRHSKRPGGAPVKVRPIDNARNVAEGVKQAHAFGKNRGCSCAVVEVYDMRKDKTADPRNHAEVKAAEALCSPIPDLRLTAIFGSAKDARNAGHIPGP